TSVNRSGPQRRRRPRCISQTSLTAPRPGGRVLSPATRGPRNAGSRALPRRERGAAGRPSNVLDGRPAQKDAAGGEPRTEGRQDDAVAVREAPALVPLRERNRNRRGDRIA